MSLCRYCAQGFGLPHRGHAMTIGYWMILLGLVLVVLACWVGREKR